MEMLGDKQKRYIEERIQGFGGQSVIAALVMGFSVIGIYKNVTAHAQQNFTQYTDPYQMVALAMRTTAASTACYSVIVISYNHFLIKRLMGYGLMRQATRFLGSSRTTRQRGAIFVPV